MRGNPLKHSRNFGTKPTGTARTISYRATHLPQAGGATDRDVSDGKMTP